MILLIQKGRGMPLPPNQILNKSRFLKYEEGLMLLSEPSSLEQEDYNTQSDQADKSVLSQGIE